MALVQVEDTRVDAERPESPHAADAEHDLLPETAIWLGHVEAVGDAAEVERVRFEVGIEKEQRDPSDLRPPDGDLHVARSDRGLDLQALDLADWQLVAAILGIHLELTAARVDVLAPEALLVQQPDRDQG